MIITEREHIRKKNLAVRLKSFTSREKDKFCSGVSCHSNEFLPVMATNRYPKPGEENKGG